MCLLETETLFSHLEYFFEMNEYLVDNVCGLNNSFCCDILTADVAIRSWRKCRIVFSTSFNHTVFRIAAEFNHKARDIIFHTNMNFKSLD